MSSEVRSEMAADEFLAEIGDAFIGKSERSGAGSEPFDSRAYATPMDTNRPPLPPDPAVSGRIEDLEQKALNPFVPTTIHKPTTIA